MTQKSHISSIISMIAHRLAYASLYPEFVFGKPERHSEKETTTVISAAGYAEEILGLLRDYFETGDFITSINYGVIDVDSVKYVDLEIGTAAEKHLKSIQDFYANNPEARKQKSEQMVTDFENDLADFNMASNGLELFDGHISTSSHYVTLNQDISEDILDNVLYHIHVLNEAYYYTYLGSTVDEEREEPGLLAGFKQGYLYVEQALDALRNLSPEASYPVKNKLRKNRFSLVQGGLSTPTIK